MPQLPTMLTTNPDVILTEMKDGTGVLRRILPPDGMVYWPSDRF